MPVSDGFVAFVLEQLDAVGPITPKRMFGGVGLYAGDLFFALLSGDVLYLKADDSTRGHFEAAGGRPFQPYPDRPERGTMQYYSVPVSVLEDGDELIAWAKASVAIARAQRASPPPRRAVPRKPRGPSHKARPTHSRKPRR
jgi:DNA transformation protein and related proteins